MLDTKVAELLNVQVNKEFYSAYLYLDFSVYYAEQGEEETNAEGLIKKYDLFGSDPRALYMLDNELAAGVYSAPSLVL